MFTSWDPGVTNFTFNTAASMTTAMMRRSFMEICGDFAVQHATNIKIRLSSLPLGKRSPREMVF